MFGLFPIKNVLKTVGTLLPLLLKFVLECAIKRVQAKWEGLELIFMHQPLVYVDNVNLVVEVYILTYLLHGAESFLRS
jgi:hypothetical protein